MDANEMILGTVAMGFRLWHPQSYRRHRGRQNKGHFFINTILRLVIEYQYMNLLGPINSCLTHWGRVTHICVSRLTITGSDNDLSPGRRKVIIWTNPGKLLIGPLGTNFSENLIEILTFSFTNMRLKVSSAKWRPFCLGLNVLTTL